MNKKNNNDVFLITGCVGFVGFHLSYFFLSQGYKIIGIDALTTYYDVNLKLKRNKILKGFDNYIFFKELLENKESLKKIIYKYKPTIVIHLAAQAGVRYSIENPYAYINSNVLGTYNLLEIVKDMKLKHFLFSSTSSIYGNSKKMPLTELQNTDNQISFYASTKKANESMLHYYSYIYKFPVTIFRFFTVYGPWGRPDMALFKFTNSILNDEPIFIYNHGNMERDFTYIDDLIFSISKLTFKIPELNNKGGTTIENDSLSPDAPWRVVNIGNSSPVNLMDFIKTLEEVLNKKAKKKFVDIQVGDVSKTWSNNTLLYNLINYTPSTTVKEGIKKFVDWYLKYYKIKD